MPLSDSLQNNKELYVRGSGYMRLLPHRQIQHAAVHADCLTSVNHRSMKTGKRGVSERQQKIMKKQKFFSRFGLRTATGRIKKFSLLKHATSPNTWAHKYILKLLNTCSQVTFLLLDPQLYRVCDASIRFYLVAQHVICFDFDLNKDHHNRKCLRLSTQFTNQFRKTPG